MLREFLVNVWFYIINESDIRKSSSETEKSSSETETNEEQFLFCLLTLLAIPFLVIHKTPSTHP